MERMHLKQNGLAWLGMAWLGRGMVWLGLDDAWLGLDEAWLGLDEAWLGLAWLGLTWLSLDWHGIFQVQALSNSQAPPQDCEQIQGDRDPSLFTAGTSLPLHHDSELATVSDPRVSLKYRGGNDTGNVKFVVPLVVTPAVLYALSVESNNTQTLTAQTPQSDTAQIQMGINPVSNVCATPSSVPLVQGSAKPSLKYGSIPG
jgi:hypothetical protein